MKRAVTVLVLALAVGCASVQSGDQLKVAALKAIGAERVAWLTNNTPPAGVDVVTLRDVRAYVDKVDASNGTALITYRYSGTFSTPQGQRDGTLTVQRRLHFTRSDNGVWTPSAQVEEVARNTSWSTARATS